MNKYENILISGNKVRSTVMSRIIINGWKLKSVIITQF